MKASWFLIDTQDEITFDSTSISATAPFGQNINIGKSRRYGIETRVDLHPFKEVDLYGSYTWTEAYVRETDPTGTLVDGRSLGQIPSHRMTWGGAVRPLAWFGEPFDGFVFGVNGVFTGSQHPLTYESSTEAILANTGGAGHVIKSYTLWDIIASYQWREFEVYLKVNNFFDTKYYSESVSATVFPAAWGGATVLPAGDYAFVIPGEPREILFGFKWEFDAPFIGNEKSAGPPAA
ncbi:mechanosensitive ion channel family protein [sediment metagenome]|uniref:Mechanosensitive ion channel family protein n=1 Tax=sediment metagenome TaxID=749907 RepID=D9PFU0_9ZZZZ